MNELTTLREAWDDPAPPSPEARAAARTALLERAAAAPGSAPRLWVVAPGQARRAPENARRIRMPRVGVRLVAVGALTAAAAATVTVVQTSGDGGRPAVPGVPSGPVANADELLARAAAAAESRPFQPPRADQWIYTHYRNMPATGPRPSRGPGKALIFEEQWERADGRLSAVYTGKRLAIYRWDAWQSVAGWPPKSYARLAALPADPDELFARAYKMAGRVKRAPAPRPGCPASPDRYMWTFDHIKNVLWGSLVPPKLEAAVYLALKKVPGITVRRLTGPGGRPEIALGRTGNGWELNETLFDARTYRFVGERSTALKDPNEIERRCGYLSSAGPNMRVAGRAIVDRPGQRP